MKKHLAILTGLSLLLTVSCSAPMAPSPVVGHQPTALKSVTEIAGQVTGAEQGDQIQLTLRLPLDSLSLRTHALDTAAIAYLKGWIRGRTIPGRVWNQGGPAQINGSTLAALTFSEVPRGQNHVVTVQAYDSNDNPLPSLLLKGYYSSPPLGTQATVTLDWRRLPTGKLLETLLDKGFPVETLDTGTLQARVDQLIYQDQPVGGKTYALHPSRLDTERMGATLHQSGGNPSALSGAPGGWAQPGATFPVHIRDAWGNPYTMGDFIVAVNDPASQPITIPSGSAQGTISGVGPGSWTLKVTLAGNPNIKISTPLQVSPDGIATLTKGTAANPLVFPLEQVVPQLLVTLNLFGTWTPLNLPPANLVPESHPSLLFSTATLPAVVSRLNRQPYLAWLATNTVLANQALGQNLASAAMNETNRSKWTKAAAAAYVLSNPAANLLTAARTGLLNMAAPNVHNSMEEWIAGGLYLGPGWGRWLEAASSLQNHLIAYDLIASTLPPQDNAVIRAKLALEAEAFYQQLPYMANNNWKIKVAAALGTAALTLADHPGINGASPQQWLNRALFSLEQGLGPLKGDGAYGESPHYANYANQNLIPFVRQLQRLTGTNLAAFPALQQYFEWTVKIAMPNGRFPAFDDSWESSVAFHPMLSDTPFPNPAHFRWLASRTVTLANMMGLEPEAIAYYNDAIPANPAPALDPIQFFPQGGEVIFRSNWDPTAVYGVFLGEGNTDSGHEHYEPGHFIIHAAGQNLALDSGYGAQGFFDLSRAWYLSPEAHNIVLVDGAGPTTSSTTQMRHSFAAPGLAGSEVTSSYGGASLKRTLYFVNNAFFVLFDQMTSPTPHQYAFVLHGNGTYSNPAADAVTWTSGSMALKTHFVHLAGGTLPLATAVGKHGIDPGVELTHTYVKASLSGQNAHLATLLVPDSQAAPVYTVTNEAVAPAGQAKKVQAGALSQTVVISDGATPVTVGNATLQAPFGLLGLTAGNLTSFSLKEGRSLTHLGQAWLASPQPLDAVFQITPGQEMHGYVAGSGSFSLTLQPGFQPAAVLFKGQPVPFVFQNNLLQLTLTGSGTLDIGATDPVPALVRIPQ